MTPASELDHEVGIGWYSTNGAPCTGRARSFPEDFRVEERLVNLETSKEDLPGYLPLYRVEKRSVDTMHMSRALASALKSRVSYAGLKDKRACAVQYVTPTSSRAARPPEVTGQGYSATLVGFVRRPLSRSVLAGNRFVITLRGCCPDIEARIEEAINLGRSRLVPNFYGLQRFGTSGAGSHRIGRSLVKGDFEGAVRSLLESPADPVDRPSAEAFGRGDYEEGARLLARGRDVERLAARELAQHPGQWTKALRAIPVSLRRLYVHAYQSLIFNRTLCRALEAGEDISRYVPGDNWAATSEGGLVTLAPRGVKDVPTGEAVPLVQVVGYAFRNYGSRFDSIIEDELKNEGVTPGQFYLKDMQEVSSEGAFRRPHIALQDPSWRVEDGNAKLEFTLGKGQYATILLREIVKPQDPRAAGFA